MKRSEVITIAISAAALIISLTALWYSVREVHNWSFIMTTNFEQLNDSELYISNSDLLFINSGNQAEIVLSIKLRFTTIDNESMISEPFSNYDFRRPLPKVILPGETYTIDDIYLYSEFVKVYSGDSSNESINKNLSVLLKTKIDILITYVNKKGKPEILVKSIYNRINIEEIGKTNSLVKIE